MIAFLHDILIDFWGVVCEMSPYLLFGFGVAGMLSVCINASLVQRHLGGGGFGAVLKASLLGVPLPLCSCGVIPVSMSLHKHGAGKAATISFLLSTPQTGVDSILVTYSLMGPIFAIFRPLMAFATGLVGGTVINLVEKHQPQPEQQPSECTDDCCANSKKQHWLVRAMKHGFVTLPTDIGRAMLVGLVVAALISAAVPEDFFASSSAVAGGGIVAMLVMMIVGIPVYICSTASVPIAAALVAKGLNPGAALVFLMTGPATNAATLVTLASQVGRRSAVIFLLTVVVCSLAGGLVLDAIFAGDVSQIVHAHGAMLPGWVEQASAVVLLGVLAAGIVRKLRKK